MTRSSVHSIYLARIAAVSMCGFAGGQNEIILGPNGEHAQHLRSGRIRLAAEPRNVRCSPQTGDYRLRDSASYCNCYRLALGIYAQVQHNVCDQHAVKTTRVPFEAMAPEWKPSKLLQRLRTSRM